MPPIVFDLPRWVDWLLVLCGVRAWLLALPVVVLSGSRTDASQKI